MVHVTVVDNEMVWHEFFIRDEDQPNLLAALGLLGNTLTPTEALELIK